MVLAPLLRADAAVRDLAATRVPRRRRRGVPHALSAWTDRARWRSSERTRPSCARRVEATAHLWIESPIARATGEGGKGKRSGKQGAWLNRMFDTHPPLDDRIQALEDDRFWRGLRRRPAACLAGDHVSRARGRAPPRWQPWRPRPGLRGGPPGCLPHLERVIAVVDQDQVESGMRLRTSCKVSIGQNGSRVPSTNSIGRSIR